MSNHEFDTGQQEQAEQEVQPQQLEIREVDLVDFSDKDEMEQRAREESGIPDLTISEKVWQITPSHPEQIEGVEDIEDVERVVDVSRGMMNLIEKIWHSDQQRYNFTRCELIYKRGEHGLTESGLIYIGAADLYGNGERAEDVRRMTRSEANRILEGVESPYRL